VLDSVGHLVTRIADLAEAEGRLLREHLVRLAVVGALVFSTLALALASLVLLVIALYMAVEKEHNATIAMAVCGGLTLLVAVVIGFVAGKVKT
jgi:hypothetical protein